MANQLVVLSVGGKCSFAPWLRLLRSYGQAGNRPINWLCLVDSDGALNIRKAYRDADFSVPQDLSRALEDVDSIYKDLKRGERANISSDDWVTASEQANSIADVKGMSLHLAPIDLEYVMLSEITLENAKLFAQQIGCQIDNVEQLLKKLGSKVDGRASSDSVKDVWVRGLLGEQIKNDQISEHTKEIVRRWLSGVVSADRAADIVSLDW
ncbi:hypothetical protein FRC91_19375 [Bradymonadales bacterium TMQ1]|nr:hypothetical protein FRC91_19375 [Bradymonadales bacterium TMQ1]